MKNIILPIV